MAKILGYRIRENQAFPDPKNENNIITVDCVELYVSQRAIGDRAKGEFCAVYKIDRLQTGYVFNVDIRKFDSLDSFLDSVVGKDCFIEKTLVGKSERVCSIVLK